MKFIIPTILSISMVAMALPKDLQVRQAFQTQCSGMQLSCCSGISQENPTTVTPTNDQAGLINAVVQVVGAVTPTNLLSGCAPLIGSCLPTSFTRLVGLWILTVNRSLQRDVPELYCVLCS
jgi:hypothetical protein